MKTIILSALLTLTCVQGQAKSVILSDILVSGYGGVLRGNIVGQQSVYNNDIIFSKLSFETAQGESFLLAREDDGGNDQKMVSADQYICQRASNTHRFSQSTPLSNQSMKGQGIILLNDGTAKVVSQTQFEAYSLVGAVTCSTKEIQHVGE